MEIMIDRQKFNTFIEDFSRDYLLNKPTIRFLRPDHAGYWQLRSTAEGSTGTPISRHVRRESSH